MRALTALALAVLCTGTPLEAQHTREYEFDMFGAYTKYDASFNLANTWGGGIRLGYLFGSRIGAELDILLQPDYPLGTGMGTMEPLIGGGSVVLNLLNAQRNIFYVVGGYSRIDFGETPPYQFTDGGFHGGVGDKLFLTNRLALRLEGRAIYTPETNASFGTKSVTHIVASAGLAIFAPNGNRPPSAASQTSAPVPVAVVTASVRVDSQPPVVLPPLPPPTPVVSDADGDGIPDSADACPNTPHGALVDDHGCAIDSDHDGVPDGLDHCPETPAGAMVDAYGCPSDSDHDGVPDGLDKCPDTPAGAVVDAMGCPLDHDHDGVPDGIDKCPTTPPGVHVDASGCPVDEDADGDGVPDSIDRCPNTPHGVPVDANGCMLLFHPDPPPQPGRAMTPARPTLILRGVNFESGRSVLTRDSYAALDLVASSLVANPEIRIEIAGYTDNTGPMGANLRLSEARAAAVRAYLARKGVVPARMTARGYGSAHPIAQNVSAPGRAQNRRVELHKLS